MTSDVREKVKEVLEEYVGCDSPLHRISTTQDDIAESLASISESLARLADAHAPIVLEIEEFDETNG